MAKILVVDDEEVLRLLMRRQLQRAKHTVIEAEDGLYALEKMKEQEFDVVVSDMRMPRMDGMSLLECSNSLYPDTEFIIITGHGSMENAVEAFKKGNVFDYLLKPLEDIHELDAVVSRAVERRELRTKNRELTEALSQRIQELEEAHNRLSFLADRDGLTGLYNHRAIHAILRASIEKDEVPVSVLMLDMDGFKRINDTYGHLTGDNLLRHVSRAITEVCGRQGEIGRCGGDEFIVVFPKMDLEEASVLARQLRDYLAENPYQTAEGNIIPVTASIGVSDTASTSGTSASLVAAADAALYSGKKAGGKVINLHHNVPVDEAIQTISSYSALDELINTIQNKDHYTKRHAEETTKYALLLGEAMSVSNETMDALRLAGLLHDVGKIGVPDHIVSKPGKLTPEEYEVMKSHVTISALIINGLPNLQDILDAVAYHHERWDGTGYPQGLRGEKIPFLGRVLAIADAYSAMTMGRPYRAAKSIEDALAEILDKAGTQFDPSLAKTFVEAMKREPQMQQSKAA